MGEGGEQLHQWAFATKGFRESHGLSGGETNADSEVVEELLGYLKAGLLDELQIHLVPLLLGDGVRLFENHLGPERRELECTRVIESPAVTHLRYRVVK